MMGIEHIALQTDDYAGAMARLKSNGAHIMLEQVSNGRHVAFIEAPDGAQMELIEKIETAKGILEEIHAAENIDARGREEALEERGSHGPPSDRRQRSRAQGNGFAGVRETVYHTRQSTRHISIVWTTLMASIAVRSVKISFLTSDTWSTIIRVFSSTRAVAMMTTCLAMTRAVRRAGRVSRRRWFYFRRRSGSPLPSRRRVRR